MSAVLVWDIYNYTGVPGTVLESADVSNFVPSTDAKVLQLRWIDGGAKNIKLWLDGSNVNLFPTGTTGSAVYNFNFATDRYLEYNILSGTSLTTWSTMTASSTLAVNLGAVQPDENGEATLKVAIRLPTPYSSLLGPARWTENLKLVVDYEELNY